LERHIRIVQNSTPLDLFTSLFTILFTGVLLNMISRFLILERIALFFSASVATILHY